MNADASDVEDINIPILKNVCCCFVLRLLRIGLESFALDHSPVHKNDLDINDMSDLRRCHQSPCLQQ